MLELRPCSGSIGVEVGGIDLCRPLDDQKFDELNKALLEYQVLFFRDQPLKPENHADMANLFGQPQMHEAYPHRRHCQAASGRHR